VLVLAAELESRIAALSSSTESVTKRLGHRADRTLKNIDFDSSSSSGDDNRANTATAVVTRHRRRRPIDSHVLSDDKDEDA